jgi:alkanesulfonate monooxygenase SsuD/methylene tetrahydromethanopterin reductase-like flavin-dependent oxidoreductase (luciferase family)
MKAALFVPIRYNGPAAPGWPVPGDAYSSEIGQKSMQASMALFQRADEVGFDWVTVAEHHYSPFSLSPNPMVIGGAMTQVVKKAKIALLGATIPILNPIRVAEEFAMLDTMSGGRLIAGMLRGSPNEYVTYNINPAESRGRFEEALQLIKMAWTETEPFGWQGRYYEYKSVSIWPRPVQQPHPKIFMSGSSPESSEFAARNHIGLGLAFTNVPQAKQSVDNYREHAERAGWTPTADDIVYRVIFHVADTDDQALEDFSTAAKNAPRGSLTFANRDLEKAVDSAGYYGRDRDAQRNRLMPRPLQESIDLGQIILGSPDTVVKQIERIHRDLGAGVLDLTIANDLGEKTLHAIDLIGTKVMPRVRHLQ